MSKPNSYEALKNEFLQFSDHNAKKILYQPTKEVLEVLGDETQCLIQEMKQKMPRYSIGLAANQIGIAKQIFIMAYTPPKSLKKHKLTFKSVPLQVFINPKITNVSDEKVGYWHGCLSAINELMGEIATYKWLDFEALNEKGEMISGRMEGMGAVIFQHEFCHLIGGLYIDCAKRMVDRLELRKLFDSGTEKIYQEVDDTVPLLLEGYLIGESISDYEERNFK